MGTDDDIKFFYFTLFKKNGFIFILICCIIHKNCFLEVLFLLIKSSIAFYLIISLIYLVLYIRKHIIIRKFIYRVQIKHYPTLLLILINYFLNILFNSKKKTDYVLTDIVGLGKFQSKFICQKFG